MYKYTDTKENPNLHRAMDPFFYFDDETDIEEPVAVTEADVISPTDTPGSVNTSAQNKENSDK